MKENAPVAADDLFATLIHEEPLLRCRMTVRLSLGVVEPDKTSFSPATSADGLASSLPAVTIASAGTVRAAPRATRAPTRTTDIPLRTWNFAMVVPWSLPCVHPSGT